MNTQKRPPTNPPLSQEALEALGKSGVVPLEELTWEEVKKRFPEDHTKNDEVIYSPN